MLKVIITIILSKISMRHINLPLYQKLTKNGQQLSLCWHIKTAEKFFGYTNYSEDLIIKELRYKSDKIINNSSFEQNNDFSENNYEFSLIFDEEEISKQQILAGELDNAYIEVFLINACELSAGKIVINSGYINNIKLKDDLFIIETSGISKKLNKEIIQLYSPFCRAVFGDKKCKINQAKYSFETQVEEVINFNQIKILPFTVQSSNLINAEIKFLSGRNSSNTNKIKQVEKTMVFLQNNVQKVVHKGDKLLITPNCDKNFTTCCNIYNNAINFRGEPNIPGIDEILKTAGTYK